MSCRQSSRVPECTEGNFLRQVIGSPARWGAILVPRVTSTGELISDSKVGGSWGCSDHTLVEFTVLRVWLRQRVKSEP